MLKVNNNYNFKVEDDKIDKRKEQTSDFRKIRCGSVTASLSDPMEQLKTKRMNFNYLFYPKGIK